MYATAYTPRHSLLSQGHKAANGCTGIGNADECGSYGLCGNEIGIDEDDRTLRRI